jgi:hypothetical protein
MPGRHDVEHGESGHSPGDIAPAENLPAPDPGGDIDGVTGLALRRLLLQAMVRKDV